MSMEEEREPQVDESLLTPGQKKELEKPAIGKRWWIFWGVLLVLITICVIVIVAL